MDKEMKDERERERRREGGVNGFLWNWVEKGSETWKCVEGGGEYPDAPFNHFIPDSIGGQGSHVNAYSTYQYCYQGQFSP
jgi:hypothetical protein